MQLNEYQERARETAHYQNVGSNILYPALGLAGETGEVVEKVKKHIHHNISATASEMSPEKREEIIKEMGDVLWNLSQLAMEFSVPFEEVAQKNLDKLASRKERGLIHGSGDNR
jgi:NTP pyrophosphatase (non-canonical NTP hydrolase)